MNTGAPNIAKYSALHSVSIINNRPLSRNEALEVASIDRTIFSRNPLQEIVHTRIDEDTFRRLVLIRNPETEVITSKVRRLDDVATYLKLHNITPYDLPKLDEWFTRVKNIYLNFEYMKMEPITLVPLCQDEEEAVNNGSWYLEGGNHRSLALALKLYLDGFSYKPIEAIIVYPR
jgi:hypothetical protein